MTRRQRAIIFASVLIVALILIVPLGAAIRLFGIDRAGLSARAASGDMWTGQLASARLGPLALGTARVGLKPLGLLAGRAEIGMNSEQGYGRIIAGGGVREIEGVTGQVSLARLLAPLPIESVSLEGASILFRDQSCARAAGLVRATFAPSIGGLSLASGMTGAVRCDGDDLLLPLIGQSALERLTIRIGGNGRWSAILAISSSDPGLTATLAAAGFTATEGGMALRLSGTL
jgi:general secretion pathway protein N